MQQSLRDKLGLLSNTFCPTGEGGGQDNSCGGASKPSRVRAVKGGKVVRYSADDLMRVALEVMGQYVSMNSRTFHDEVLKRLGFPATAGDFKDVHYKAIDHYKNTWKDLCHAGMFTEDRRPPFQVSPLRATKKGS